MKKTTLPIAVVLLVLFAGISTYSYLATKGLSKGATGDPFLWLTYYSKYDWRTKKISNITKRFSGASIMPAAEAYDNRAQLLDKLIIIEGTAELIPFNAYPMCFASFPPSRCYFKLFGFSFSKFDAECYSCRVGFRMAGIPLPYNCHHNGDGSNKACELEDGATYKIAGYWRAKADATKKMYYNFEAIGYEKQ